MIPAWWQFTLLSLAAYRVWRLLAEDTILDRPRAWVLGAPGWKPTGHETPPEGYRDYLATFLTCPWCMGAHLSLGIYLLWLWGHEVTLAVSTPLALSALVGLIAKLDT